MQKAKLLVIAYTLLIAEVIIKEEVYNVGVGFYAVISSVKANICVDGCVADCADGIGRDDLFILVLFPVIIGHKSEPVVQYLIGNPFGNTIRRCDLFFIYLIMHIL